MVADSLRVSMVADWLKKVQYVAAVYKQSCGLLVVLLWLASDFLWRVGRAPAGSERARGPGGPARGYTGRNSYSYECMYVRV